MANQGIIFSNIFINNKEMFVDFFEQIYKVRREPMIEAISKLDRVLSEYTTKNITEKMATEFKIVWANFEKEVMLNSIDLQLIVAYRGAGGKDGRFSQILKQEDVEGVQDTKWGKQYGIKAGSDLVKDSIKALEASNVEKFLQLHLNGLLKQLETKINHDEAYDLHQFHTDCLMLAYQNSEDNHLEGALFRNAFYANDSNNFSYYYSGRGLGQVYDAYLNHMANKETWIYDYLRTGGTANLPGNNFNKKDKMTVYEEEGKVVKGANFPTLLKNSRNHTGWYTGGDIVIINPETLNVVYNIQLKTTTEDKGSVFQERVENIRKFITEIKNKSPKEMAERIFDFMLTSVSNEEDFNNIPQEDIDEMIKSTLKMKLDIVQKF